MKKLFVSVLFIFITTMTFAKPLDRTMINTFWQKGLLIIYDNEGAITYVPKSAIISMHFTDWNISIVYGNPEKEYFYYFEKNDFSLDSNSNIIIRKKTIETEQ